MANYEELKFYILLNKATNKDPIWKKNINLFPSLKMVVI